MHMLAERDTPAEQCTRHTEELSMKSSASSFFGTIKKITQQQQQQKRKAHKVTAQIGGDRVADRDQLVVRHGQLLERTHRQDMRNAQIFQHRRIASACFLEGEPIRKENDKHSARYLLSLPMYSRPVKISSGSGSSTHADGKASYANFFPKDDG
jgi:hypothetical protein